MNIGDKIKARNGVVVHYAYALLRNDGTADTADEFDLLDDAIEHAKKFGWPGVVERRYVVSDEAVAWHA